MGRINRAARAIFRRALPVPIFAGKNMAWVRAIVVTFTVIVVAPLPFKLTGEGVTVQVEEGTEALEQASEMPMVNPGVEVRSRL
jgi:hypothetical protein